MSGVQPLEPSHLLTERHNNMDSFPVQDFQLNLQLQDIKLRPLQRLELSRKMQDQDLGLFEKWDKLC